MTGSTTAQAGATVPADISPPPASFEVAMTGLESLVKRICILEADLLQPFEHGGDDRDA